MNEVTARDADGLLPPPALPQSPRHCRFEEIVCSVQNHGIEGILGQPPRRATRREPFPAFQSDSRLGFHHGGQALRTPARDHDAAPGPLRPSVNERTTAAN